MSHTRKINDSIIKLMGIPLLGIIIPNISGLITNSLYSAAGLFLCYAGFIIISLIIWQGNLLLMHSVREKLEWKYISYYKSTIVLFFTNLIFSGSISFPLLYIWKKFSKEIYTGQAPIINTSLIIIFTAAFITNIYEIVFLNHEKEDNLSRVEQLNTAKAQAELEALKNQIDPHFIFNSLNTLSYLITADPQNACLFNDTLAKVYRYILCNKEKDLVLLIEEIEFISNYFFLLKIRFGESVNMEIEINDLSAEDFLIPPISLQALVENAIKHNDFNINNPLGINISVSSNYIIVKNILQPKIFAMPGSKIGLSNLDNRYKLITSRNIVVENNAHFFSVKLPVLKI
jgi:two-component system, LytTR family, sensor kinase